jgi:hypothetical protein
LGLVVPQPEEDKVSFSRNLLRYFIPILFLLAILSWEGQASAGQLQLSWTDNSNNEDGFRIERKTGTSGTYAEIAKLGANVTSYTDTNLIDGATYCYQLRAFNSAGSSAYSPEGCATVKSTLSITKTGSGTVTSSPAGINCGGDCSESYTSGTIVSLNATAAAGSVFTGWSGNSDCTDGAVTMNSSKTCTATFTNASQTFALNVSVVKASSSAGTGNGTVTSNPAGINCGNDCSESYTSGTVAVLTATPAAGSVFTGWSGDSDCSDGSVIMKGNRNCAATFNAVAMQTFGLSINKTGNGSGTVTSSPAGINCGNDCSQSYASGMIVTLVATPAAGSVFSGWNGSGCSNGSVTMNASRSCTAVFSTQAAQISRIGIFRPSVDGWYLDLNGNDQWDGCGVDACYGFGGLAGDIAVVGDWTGTGQANIGIYRNGGWALDLNSNGQWDGCGVDGCFGFGGTAGDMPVVGDWTGSGTAKVGIFRDGGWALDLNGNGRWDGCGVDGCFGFGGTAGDIPVVGDWTGSGTAKIGIFRDGGWALDLNGNGQWDGCAVDACIGFGELSGNTPVVGDWTGSGTAKIGVYRDGGWALDLNGNGRWDGCAADACIGFGGLAEDIPVVGNW